MYEIFVIYVVLFWSDMKWPNLQNVSYNILDDVQYSKSNKLNEYLKVGEHWTMVIAITKWGCN